MFSWSLGKRKATTAGDKKSGITSSATAAAKNKQVDRATARRERWRKMELEAQKVTVPFSSTTTKDSTLNVLIRSGKNIYRPSDSTFVPPVLTALKNDILATTTCSTPLKKAEEASIVPERFHHEIDSSILTLPGYKMVLMPPRFRFSRMRNLLADTWEDKIHHQADCFVYAVNIPDMDKYPESKRSSGVGTTNWEQDRYQISLLLRQPRVVESPKKPLLLLLLIGKNSNNEEYLQDLDLAAERVANLLGLGDHHGNRLGSRPIRTVAYSLAAAAADDRHDEGSSEWIETREEINQLLWEGTDKEAVEVMFSKEEVDRALGDNQKLLNTSNTTMMEGGADNNEESQRGVLKDAMEWLAATSPSTQEEDDTLTAGTGANTEYETEDERSVFTTTSTIMSGSFLGATTDNNVEVQADAGGHYILDYEPTLLGGNATLQRFEPVKTGTHCPFAKAARLWGGKVPHGIMPRFFGRSSDDLVQEMARLNAGPLAEFVARSNSGESLDGFCMEIPNGQHMKIEYLGEQVCKLLTMLADLDPSGENAMKSLGSIGSPHWRFRFAGEDFFLTTFSPVYKVDSSRHAFGANRAFLLFQPLTSFGRHGLIQDTPASSTNWNNPTTMRDKARVAFQKNGCPYHIPEELPYPVAEHVVKPEVDDGTNVVRWWLPREKQEPLKAS